MRKLLKCFIAICLCFIIVGSTGCGLGSISAENAQELIDTGILKYPANNEYFRYNVYTGYVAITQCLSKEKYIEVPDEIEGLPVLGINTEAFLDNTTVETIKLGNNMYYIEEYAFYGCTALKQINLPKTIIEIGEGAFEDCSSLKQISVPENVETISANLFYNCLSLEKVIIEETDNVQLEKFIDSAAFANCKNLSFVWLPNEITEISEDAFDYAPTNLKIYSYAGSVAADFCATNLINFSVLDRNNFDNITILSNKISVPQYKTINDTITSDNWKITLVDYKEYASIGKYKPAEDNVYLMITFNITNLSTSDAFFNFLNLKPVVSGYIKSFKFLNTSTINSYKLLTGVVEPQQTHNGYLLLEVNKNWIYAYIDFVDIDGFEDMENFETRLAVYPSET